VAAVAKGGLRQHVLEEGGAGGQDELVRWHGGPRSFQAITSQSDVEEVGVGAQLSKRGGDGRLEIVPALGMKEVVGVDVGDKDTAEKYDSPGRSFRRLTQSPCWQTVLKLYY